MRNRDLSIAVFLLLVTASALLVGPCLAQDATGTVLGTVVDPQGSVVPNVQVTVTNVATGQKSVTKTGPDGTFRVLNLPIGNYTVAAEGAGFQKLVTKPQPLQINQNLRFDLQMKVGSAQETIEVASDAVAVETVSSTLGQSVTSRPIVDLPLNGRNVLSLALLQPGVTESNDDSTAAGNFSVGGGRSDSVTYLLDGGVNNNLLSNAVVYTPNPDTIAEFRILQNNYSAEYGRNGGGIVSVVTKSGTNSLHGSVFDYLRNDAFNANRYFNKIEGAPRDVLKRNQYGATLGGPIKKDKVFFFVGYQGQRQTTTDPSGVTTTYTPAQLNGDFSHSWVCDQNGENCGPGPDPYVASFLQTNPSYIAPGHTYKEAIINPAMIDPAAQKYIAAGLIPTTTSPDGSLASFGAGSDNRNELTVKLDYTATTKDKISLTLGQSKTKIVSPFLFATVNGFPNINKDDNYFATFAYARTFTNAVLNEFRFTAQRANGQRRLVGKKLPTASDLGVGITPDDATGPPNLLFDSGLAVGFSENGPTHLVNNTFSYTDTLSWVKGRHTWKFGAGFTPYQNNTIYDYYVNGEFDFSTLADFLLGNPYALYQYPRAPSNIRSKNTFLFAQDEWHVGRRLVLNLGVRYEYSTPKTDTQGRSFSFIPGVQSTVFPNAPNGLVFPGDKGAPTGANFPDKNDWAPRFGFAWDPFGNGKMSVRGGFGVSYDILKGEDNLQFNGQPPFFSSVGICCSNFGPGGLDDPFGVTNTTNPFPSHSPDHNLDFAASGFLPINGGESVYVVDPHLRTPYTYQYNLGIQRELLKGTLAEVSYAGSLSRKLTSLVDTNPMDPASIQPVYVQDPTYPTDPTKQVLGWYSGNRIYNEAAVNQACNAASPSWAGYCYAYMPEFKNVVNQEYNALDVSVTRQPTETGFLGKTYFTFGYTWSHNIDNSSGFRERNSQVPFWNTNYFRASADIDVRHRITFSGGWDMAFDRWWGSGPKRLTQGWSWYPILTWRTGFPFDIPAHFASRFDPAEVGPSGYGDAYLANANSVGPANIGMNKQGSNVFWFNPSSFSRACEYVNLDYNLENPWQANCPNGYGSPYGTVKRNSFRAPGKTNLDLALSKTTKITERVSAQFRAEAFNLFNHAEFKTPNTDIRQSQFGRILDTYEPRILQLALRFQF